MIKDTLAAFNSTWIGKVRKIFNALDTFWYSRCKWHPNYTEEMKLEQFEAEKGCRGFAYGCLIYAAGLSVCQIIVLLLGR